MEEEQVLLAAASAVTPGSTGLSGEALITKDAVTPVLPMEERLLKVAIDYQKTSSAQKSTQDPLVLVTQILEQIREGRTTISFAIPYNPAFINRRKKRSKDDGLDIATRESLNNINSFARRVADITGKKVIFTLLYDSDLSFGLCEEKIARRADYLVGFEAIHRYMTGLNERSCGKTQMVEWDSVADPILRCPQSTEFLTPAELESAYTRRLEKIRQLLSTPEGMAELKQYVESQITERSIRPEEADILLNYNWLRNTFNIDDRDFAIQVATSTALFKAIDAEKNGGSVIRLSPHVKTASERSKFGFAFFPGTEELTEPWVGNYVANSDGSFTINPHKNERSLEEARGLREIAEAKAERRRKAEEVAEAKAERRRKALEEAAERVKSKAERRLVVQGKAEVAAEAEFREQEAPRPSTSIGEEVREELSRVPTVGERESKTPTKEVSAEISGDPSFVERLEASREEKEKTVVSTRSPGEPL